MNNKYFITLLALSSIWLVKPASVKALSVNLYDGSGFPESQGYLAPAALSSAGTTVTPQVTDNGINNGITIDSNANSAEYSGYTNQLPNPSNPSELVPINPAFPDLSQDIGYSIFFTVALDILNDFSDTNDNNRAAFSITAIGKNNEGIELGFDRDRIFAQSNNFVSEETAPFITSNTNSYELKVNSSGYQLFANNGAIPILNGSLRTYNFTPSASQPPLTFNPYTTENFLFLGDNTGQAHGNFTLGAVSVSSVPFDFSPTLGLALVGIGISLRKVYSKKIAKLQ